MKYFNQLTDVAGNGYKSAVKAVPAWLFLIGKAYNRQLIRYTELSNVLGYTDNRPLTPILGHIMYFCQDNGLPPLTILVVNESGQPGEGFTQVSRQELDQKREDTFQYNWHNLVPPTSEEFSTAWANHH